MRFEKVSKSQYLKDSEGDVYINAPNSEDDIPPFFSLSNKESTYESIKLPKRATKKSAGYDFFAPYDFSLYPGQTIKLATGIRVILDEDKFLMCAPRSSHGFRARIQLDNTIGIIDADYSESSNEGHIHIKLTNDSRNGACLDVNKGDAFMQAIILQYFKVDDDNSDSQRDGGFGSTDKK